MLCPCVERTLGALGGLWLAPGFLFQHRQAEQQQAQSHPDNQNPLAFEYFSHFTVIGSP